MLVQQSYYWECDKGELLRSFSRVFNTEYYCRLNVADAGAVDLLHSYNDNDNFIIIIIIIIILFQQISSNGCHPLLLECHGLVDQISWLAWKIIIASDRRPETKQGIEGKIVRFRSGRVKDKAMDRVRARDKDRRSKPDRRSEAINFGAC